IENSFELFWQHPLSVAISDIVEATDEELNVDVKYAYVHQYACNPENFWPQVREKIKMVPKAFQEIQHSGKFVWVEDVTFVSDVPRKNDGMDGLSGGGLTTTALINLIKDAKESVYIQSPYLVTTELGQQLFKETTDRGVTIKILTNS